MGGGGGGRAEKVWSCVRYCATTHNVCCTCFPIRAEVMGLLEDGRGGGGGGGGERCTGKGREERTSSNSIRFKRPLRGSTKCSFQ